MDFAGSVMIVVAESAEEAKNMLKDDVYVKADVWDFEKVRMTLAVLHWGYRDWHYTPIRPKSIPSSAHSDFPCNEGKKSII